MDHPNDLRLLLSGDRSLLRPASPFSSQSGSAAAFMNAQHIVYYLARDPEASCSAGLLHPLGQHRLDHASPTDFLRLRR
jgi:hypothetical protein